jgi:hypothetical protein
MDDEHDRPARFELVIRGPCGAGSVGAVERLAERHHAHRRQPDIGESLSRRTAEVDRRQPGVSRVGPGRGEQVRIRLDECDVPEQRRQLHTDGARPAPDIGQATGSVQAQLPRQDSAEFGRIRRTTPQVVRSRPTELRRVVLHASIVAGRDRPLLRGCTATYMP